MHSLHNCTWSPWSFMGSTWTVPAILNYSLKGEDEGEAHIPWFEGNERKEPWYFLAFTWSHPHTPSLIRDIAPFRQFSFLFSTQ